MTSLIAATCDECLRRTWLLDQVSGYLEFQRNRIDDVLSLGDEQLIGLWQDKCERGTAAGQLAGDYQRFGAGAAEAARAKARAAGLELLCRCDRSYPRQLLRLCGPPAVLHIAGGLSQFLALADHDPVAIVGTRRATAYGLDVAETLGRGVSVSGLCVVSGMATGIDAAAHRGALAGGGRTVAVLPGCAAEAYPKANRQLYGRIVGRGVAVSELGPGASVRKWTLLARNRIIAALSQMTIVVQARRKSGALNTAAAARRIGSRIGAVPGSILVAQSDGPHELLMRDAVLIRGPQDVLDASFGAGARSILDPASSGLGVEQLKLLDAIRSGSDTLAALTSQGSVLPVTLALLAELEIAGCVRRATGGRYVVTV